MKGWKAFLQVVKYVEGSDVHVCTNTMDKLTFKPLIIFQKQICTK